MQVVQDLDDPASFFARATLDFDRMVPSGLLAGTHLVVSMN